MDSEKQGEQAGLSQADLIRLKKYLIVTLKRALESEGIPAPQREAFINQRILLILEQAKVKLPEVTHNQILEQVLNDLLGFGPIQDLLDDPGVSEIMVNGPKNIFVEREGRLSRVDTAFDNDEHVLRLIERIVQPLGRRVDADSPTVDARLPDGSRVNAVVSPVAIDGPSITIRKFSKERLQIADLIRFGSLTEGMAEFLRACVVARFNIVISGGTGSGKTTLECPGYIPEKRIITIGSADFSSEIMSHDQVCQRMARAVTTRPGRKSLHAPDRIVVGSAVAGRRWTCQAMNTGHDGSPHRAFNAPRDALAIWRPGIDGRDGIAIKVIRQQISSVAHLIVKSPV
jgi:pilus assembly protein CpaF